MFFLRDKTHFVLLGVSEKINILEYRESVLCDAAAIIKYTNTDF